MESLAHHRNNLGGFGDFYHGTEILVWVMVHPRRQNDRVMGEFFSLMVV
jgi:hypothetical protein